MSLDAEKDSKLRGSLLELFELIKHGDEEHQQWLYDKILQFQKEKIICLNKNSKI